MAGRRAYVWHISRTIPSMLRYDMNGKPYVVPADTLRCSLTLEADPDGVVTRHRVSGQLGACSDLAG